MIKKTLLIFAILLFSFTPMIVYGGNEGDGMVIGANNPGSSPGSNNGDTSNPGKTPCSSSCSGSIESLSCTSSYGLSSQDFKVKVKVFDFYNNSILKGNNNYVGEILAGASVGISVNEHREATWWAGGTMIGTCVECTIKSYCRVRNNITGVCKLYGYIEDCDGNKLYCTYDSGCYASNAAKGQALAEAYVNSGPSYKANIGDPNDAKCNSSNTSESEKKALGCKSYQIKAVPKEIKYSGNTVSRDFSYEFSKSCINAKSSKVRYLENEDDLCTKDEYTISTDKDHWHVFFPLNQKTLDQFDKAQIKLEPSNEAQEPAGICNNFITKYEKNHEYCNYIEPIQGEFSCTNTNVDRKRVANGCRKKITIDIPLAQKFYNEEAGNGTSKLKGFNFYYRPININNPFPNGISNDSYWYDKDTSFIKDSFRERTYQVDVSPNTVKDYKYEGRELKYTSWDNMQFNGLSQFISDIGSGIRNNNVKDASIYNLGCGPLNQCKYYIDKNNQKTQNPMYQPECGGAAIKTGDVCP